MADYDFLPASNGSGDAALMHIQTDRLTGSTLIDVDTVVNVPAKFIGTSGTLLPTGFINPATKKDMKCHVSGADIIIDAFEPGSTDTGNTAGQVLIVKPNTGWANRVATFIKNATGFGSPEAVTFAGVTAGAVSSASSAVAGNESIGGNLTVTGTSRVVPVTIASSATITPSAQVYNVTALAVPATVAAPTLSAADGQSVIIRIKDNGTARALTFAAGYTNVSGLDTPTTTVANKLLTIGAMYNSTTTKWEIQGLNQEA